MLRRLLFQNTYRPMCVASASAAGFQRHQHQHQHQATVETSSQGTITAPHLIGKVRRCVTSSGENDNNDNNNNNNNQQQASSPSSSPSSSTGSSLFDILKKTMIEKFTTKMQNLPENDNNKSLWNEVATFHEPIATAAVEYYFQEPTSDDGRIPLRQGTKLANEHLHYWFFTNQVPVPQATAFDFAARLIGLVDECYKEESPKLNLQQIYERQRRRLFRPLVPTISIDHDGHFDVFASATLEQETNNRHQRNSSFGIRSRSRLVLDEIKKMWSLHSGRVILLCGSSGSGKTVMALDVAQNAYPRTIVFFLQACDLITGVNGSGTKRDETVKANLLHACETIMNKESGIVPARFDNIMKMYAPDTHVIVVLDECGSEPQVLRGFISIAPSLSVTLHNQIFTDPVNKSSTTTSSSRVHFVAAGTGAAYSTYMPGSKADHYSSFYLDASGGAEQESIYNSLRSDEKLWNADERTFLARLSPEWKLPVPSVSKERKEIELINQQLSIEEEHMKDIVTNARAGASFLEFCRKAPRGEKSLRMWATTLPAFRQFVSSSIPMVIQSYFSANGLQTAASPVETLAFATAVALYPFPFAPATLNPSEIMQVLPKSQKDVDKSLADITQVIDNRNFLKIGSASTHDINYHLCTKGGVLVDFCERKKAPEITDFEITEFVPKFEPSAENFCNDPDKQDGAFCLDPKKTPARFLLPAAQAAMSFTSAGLPSHRSSSHWSGTEHLAADVCTVLAGSSRAIHNLLDAVNAEMNHFCGKTMKDYHAAMKNYNVFKDPLFQDPLLALKQLLLFDRSVASADYHQLHDSPLKQINAAALYDRSMKWFETFAYKYPKAEESAIQLNQFMEKALSENQALVLQSPDMEQFADLIVVGPGRVILIQCKSNVKDGAQGSIDYFVELLKMRVLNGDSFVIESPKNIRYRERIGNMLRELWLAAILHAADRSSEKGKFATWVKAQPRTWSKKKIAFSNGLEDANLVGTCPSGKVDLHVCFFIETKQQSLKEVEERFQATVIFDESKKPLRAREIIKDEKGVAVPKANGLDLEFRSDVGLKSVELVAFARDSPDSQRALSPFRTSSVLKPRLQHDFMGRWKISNVFGLAINLDLKKEVLKGTDVESTK